MKKFICISLIALSILGLVACNKDTEEDMGSIENPDQETILFDKSDFKGSHQIEIEVQDYGKIYLDLDEEIAPITVNNFIKLAKDGFYDGLTFHRIISGFMIQGGDPLGNGTGGSEETIIGEFAANGVKNTLPHSRGAISMARSNDYNSASSQFFIIHEDSPHLDGIHAVFGYVREGIEIIDDICAKTPVQDMNGTVVAEDQPLIKSIKIIE